MNKIKWILLALVLCLGLVGGAYAAWSETLVITGSAETADFDIYFDENTIIVQERAKSTDSWTLTRGHEAVGPLDYGRTTASLAGNTYTFKLEGVYPGYESLVDITIINNSSIPVEVRATALFDQGITDQFSSKLSTMNGWDEVAPNTWITNIAGEEDIYIENKVLGGAVPGNTEDYEVTWTFEFQQGVGSKAF